MARQPFDHIKDIWIPRCQLSEGWNTFDNDAAFHNTSDINIAKSPGLISIQHAFLIQLAFCRSSGFFGIVPIRSTPFFAVSFHGRLFLVWWWNGMLSKSIYLCDSSILWYTYYWCCHCLQVLYQVLVGVIETDTKVLWYEQFDKKISADSECLPLVCTSHWPKRFGVRWTRKCLWPWIWKAYTDLARTEQTRVSNYARLLKWWWWEQGNKTTYERRFCRRCPIHHVYRNNLGVHHGRPES